MSTDALERRGATNAIPATANPPTGSGVNERILQINDFCVDYGVDGSAVRAVDGVDLHLDRSKVLGIAGESGSGKSTLVYGFTRLLRAPALITGGTAFFNVGPANEGGPDEFIDLVTANEATLRRVRWTQISVVLQSALNALNPVVRVSKLFDQVFKAHRREMSRADRRARAIELLDLVGLNQDRLQRFPHELSGGQRQRVMIALALALDPKLVIMDEPTTALDVVTQREILGELAELRARFGFAMIFITHDLSLLVELADEIVVMYAGRLVERAGARALYEAPRHPYTLGLLNSFPPMHGERQELTGIPGSPPDLSDLPGGCAFHPRCPYAMDRCTTESPPLAKLGDDSRYVACWLHVDDAHVVVPVELRRAVPIASSGDGGAT
ncbi:MAG: ABC transporter ATP-binding protein [Acidimicrobiales bacterium]